MQFIQKISVLIGILILTSCGSDSVSIPDKIKGTWTSSKQKITIRNKTETGQYAFFSDSLDVSFEIHDDNTASGSIGSESFSKGKIKKNKGLPPHLTGVAYIIECGRVGKLFPADPLDGKTVELWISPDAGNDNLEAELRYSDGVEDFPMAGIKFKHAPKN
jgi:hypothetical protein